MKPKSFPRFAASHTACAAAVAIALTLPAAFAATATKAASGTDLTLAASWSGGSGPGFPTSADTATWASTSLGAGLTLGSDGSWGGISITSALSDIAITGAGTLTLAGGGIDMSSSTVNLSLANPVSLGAAQAWNVGSGRTLTSSGGLGGSATLTKSGAGTLTLSGTNTSTGAVVVSAGTLKGGAANAFGPATPAAGTSITTGATLDLGGFAQTTGTLSGGGIVTSSAASGSLTLGGDNATASFTGTLNSGNITTVNKSGTGTQTLTGAGFWATANTTPQYNILDGTLTIDATGVANVANITPAGWAVSPNKTFNLSYNTAASTLLFKTGALSGAGTVNLSGVGCIDFWSSGTSSSLSGFSGQLNIGCSSLSIQTLNLAQATTTASVDIASGKFLDLRSQGFGCDKLTGTGIVADSHSAGGFGTLTVGTANGTSQFDGTIKDTDTSMIGYAAGGGIALTKAGTGTFTITGPTTFTGATTINDGTLAVSNASGWASNVSFATTNSPKLQINTPLAADAWNFTKVISGANANATFEKSGAGSVTISTPQTYTGATAVSGGALMLTSIVPTQVPGAVLWLDASDASTLFKDSAGTLPVTTTGDVIARWNDKSGNGNNVTIQGTQTGPTYQMGVGLTGQSAARFGVATTCGMTTPVSLSSGNCSIFVVYSYRSTTSTGRRVIQGKGSNWLMGPYSNAYQTYNGGFVGGAPAVTANQLTLHDVSITTGGTLSSYVNGTLAGTRAGTYPGQLIIGAGTGNPAYAEPIDGDVVEVLVYNTALTTAQRQGIETYLQQKWVNANYNITSLNSGSAVSVASGATFGGVGSAGNIAVSGGGTLEGGISGAGTLTANNVTSSGTAKLKGSLSATVGSKTFSVNNLTLNGGDQSLLVDVTGSGLTNGNTYDLLVSANPITAPGATGATDAARAQSALKGISRVYTPVIDATGKKIQVIYDATSTVYWTGAASNSWNTSATNWKLSGNNLDTQFQANDVVYFHDSPTSNVVDISGADVNPASITFDNTVATAYTLQGSNGISTGTITKSNGGTLTITNANTTSGAVALNGGTVSLAQSGGLGSGPISFGGGSLSYGGSSTNWSRSLTLNAAATISVDNAATTFTQAGAVTGNGDLTKTGSGTLTLSGPNTHTGAGIVNGGTLILSGLTTGSNNGNVGGNQLSTAALNIGATAVFNVGGTTKFATANGGFTLTGGGVFKLASGYWLMGNAGGGTTISQSAGAWIDVLTGATLSGDYNNVNWTGNHGSLNVNGSFDLRNNNYTVDALTGSGTIFDNGFSNTLTIGRDGTTNNATYGVANNTATFSGVIGTGGTTVSLIKTNSGTQILTGANTYTGGTTISGGVLQIGNGTVNGTINGTYSIASGTSLYLNYATAAAPTWANLSGAGTVRLNSAQAVNGSANWGTPALGAGFTGMLQLDKGRVDTVPAGLGGATHVLVGNGAQFLAFNNTANSYTFNQNFSLNGMGWGETGTNFGALRVSAMTATFAGNITLTGDSGLYLQSNASGAMTVSGNVSGNQALTIYNDRGTAAAITLAGAKTYTGATTLSRGLMSVDTLADGNSNSSIGASSNAASNLVISSTADATLRYTGATTSTDRNFTLTAGRTSTFDIFDAASSLTIIGGSTNTTGALTKSGAGTLILNGSNQHTGITTVSSGTLGGTGTLSGALTVSASGTIAPGTTSTGTLNTGATTLSGTYACQLDGANSDKLAVSGNLNLTGATLAVSSINNAPSATSYLIATYTGTLTGTPTVTGLPGYTVDTNTTGQIKLVGSPIYSSWAASSGLTGANGGQTQDPDGDNSNNLMEFAFGTDPLVSSSGSLTYSGGVLTAHGQPTTSITNLANGVDYRAVFCRRKDYLAAGLTYTVQFSVDFTTWTDSSATPTVVASDAEFDAVSVPYPLFITTPRGVEKPTFFRVAVTSNP